MEKKAYLVPNSGVTGYHKSDSRDQHNTINRHQGVVAVVDAAENRSPKFYGGPQSVSCCAMISNSLILGDLPEQKRPEYVEGFAPSRAGQGDTLRRGIRGAIVACHWLILVVIRGSSTIVKSSSSWLSQRQSCNPEKKNLLL